MDVQIYSFVIPTLISLWKLTPADAGLLATCTLLISAFGGWLTGILADRFGRVLMLQVTIAWFAGFTFLFRQRCIQRDGRFFHRTFPH